MGNQWSMSKEEGDVATETFRFDAKKSTDENLELFWSHLASINPTFAKLLAGHIGILIPLPSQAKQKSDCRNAFNRKILEALEQLREENAKRASTTGKE